MIFAYWTVALRHGGRPRPCPSFQAAYAAAYELNAIPGLGTAHVAQWAEWMSSPEAEALERARKSLHAKTGKYL